MENTEEPKEDLGKDGNLTLDHVCNNSSLDRKYGHKDRQDVNLSIGQKKGRKIFLQYETV